MDISQLNINGVYAGDFKDAQSRQYIEQIQQSLTKLGQNYTGISWKISDVVKTIQYVGDVDYKTRLTNWIDNSPKPCEVKKDGTDFAYLRNTSGVASATNWSQRENGSAAHQTNEDYLQCVELFNVNIAEIIDVENDRHSILFNLDELCPAGFRRFLVEPSKLFNRYDFCFAGQDAASTTVSACKGLAQPTGNFSFENVQTLVAATGSKILKLTGWEIAVISWLEAFRFGTLNMQSSSLGSGLSSGSESAARGWVSGTTDSLTTPHGAVSGGFRFMYMENVNYGKQWLMGWGVRGNLNMGYCCTDDIKANAKAIPDIADCDLTFSILPTSGTYAKEVNILGVLTATGGSDTSGFFDGNWSNVGASDRILYVGGRSTDGSFCGAFARNLPADVPHSGWGLRARGAMRKSAVVSA